jgi:hypothetical protein
MLHYQLYSFTAMNAAVQGGVKTSKKCSILNRYPLNSTQIGRI